ncbi:hypothetical protein ABMA70_01895 [Halobacteriovorax sp. XZX-3]|uniref:hypothetical protein n=1 Tax=unclassified Halobacteriovorax TaxID=2639665 RepID=UPI0011AFB7B5|nr:hypothetical protein [Halobacteriovorax sp. DA5]
MEMSFFERVKIHALSNEYVNLKTVGQQVYCNDQMVCGPTRWDKKLLRHSYALYGVIKREVMQIRFHLEGNIILESKIFKGSSRSVSDYKTIMNTMLELESEARKCGLAIIKAEIAHTHLSSCYIDRKKFKLCLLSKNDLEVAKRLKQFREYPIEIKAIAKDGLVFKKIF